MVRLDGVALGDGAADVERVVGCHMDAKVEEFVDAGLVLRCGGGEVPRCSVCEVVEEEEAGNVGEVLRVPDVDLCGVALECRSFVACSLEKEALRIGHRFLLESVGEIAEKNCHATGPEGKSQGAGP